MIYVERVVKLLSWLQILKKERKKEGIKESKIERKKQSTVRFLSVREWISIYF